MCESTVRRLAAADTRICRSSEDDRLAYSGRANTAEISAWLNVIGPLGVLGYPVLDGHLPPDLSLKVLFLELSARANTHTLFLIFPESGF